MKSAPKLTGLLACAGFGLALSLSAQTSAGSASPAPGAKPGVGEKSPVSNKPVTPNPSPHDPSVTTPPADTKPGAGLTPGAANSGSGAGGRETVRPDLGTVNDPAGTRSKQPSVAAPQFNTMDADRDGRISATEFTAPSAAWLRNGAADPATSASAAPGNRGPLDRPSPATTPRSGAPNSTAGENHDKLFKQLDTNHDGYLSPTELETYRAPTTSER